MIDFKIKKLSGGLTLVMVPMKTESVTVLGTVRAGSRDEIEGEYGGAHFLEHMVFKGTEKYPKVGDVAKVVEGVGGVQNAYTWNDLTAFWVKTTKDKWKTGVDIVGELMSSPLLKDEEFQKERGTILEEIKMYEDNYPVLAADKLDGVVFSGTDLERSVIGTERSIEEMGVKNLKDFYDRWYWAENMMVVVAGGLEKEEKIEREIEDKFRSIISKGSFKDERKESQVKDEKEKRVVVTERDIKQIHMVFGAKGYGPYNKKGCAWEVMNQILGGGMTSRLWKEVREKRGLAYYVVGQREVHKDMGVSTIRGGYKRDAGEEVIKVVKGILDDLRSKKVMDKELKMAKEALKGKFKLRLESNNQAADWVAMDWVLRGGRVRETEKILKEIDEVSAEDVLGVAKDIWRDERLCLSVVGPFKDKSKFEKVLKS